MTYPSRPAPSEEEGGQERLQALGYSQELDRKLSLKGVVAITLSDITPAGSLLVVGIAVVALAGTGSVLAYIIGGFLAITVALCVAELGSVFPVAGGVYSIVARVLGRPPAFIALLNYIGQGVFLPASIALGIGVYLHSLNDAIPVNATAGVAMIVVTLMALLRIHVNALVTGIFLVLEMSVIIVIAAAGYSHPSQSLASAIASPVTTTDGVLTAVATGAVLAAVALAMQSVNGFDAALAFSEETRGSARVVGQAVIIAAVAGVVLELTGFFGAVIGAADLRSFVSSDTPLTGVVAHYWGDTVVLVVVAGAIIAFFNAALAITLQFSRVVWVSARDRVWPGPVSNALSQVHPRLRTPWVATLVIGGLATFLSFYSTLLDVVTFVAILTIILYLFSAVAVLVSRIQQKGVARPFRLPVWPIPPIIVLIGVGVALSQQAVADLITVAVIYIVGLIYYFVYVRTRGVDIKTLGEGSGPEDKR